MPAAAAKKSKAPTKPLRRIKRQRTPQMLAQEEWPIVDETLVDYLERTFPQKPLVPGAAPDQAMYDSGWQGLIRLLRQRLDVQQGRLEE